jgi:plasmid maintenance system antidote protein VapI
MEVQGWLRATGVTVEQVATLVDRHRATISPKLRGTQDVTAVELIEMGERIGRHKATGGKR